MALLDAGCDPLLRDGDRETPLHRLYCDGFHGSDEDYFQVFTALVAAGDRSWQYVPIPCPGIEAAMESVWENAPGELPELLKRMENPPQTMMQLFHRMPDGMKQLLPRVRLNRTGIPGFFWDREALGGNTAAWETVLMISAQCNLPLI